MKLASIKLTILAISMAFLSSTSFAYTTPNKQPPIDSTKSVYAVMTVSFDDIQSTMIIEYSNGHKEDFVKIDQLKNKDLLAFEKRYVLSAFKYMSRQGYEFQSCMYAYGNREYYFVRKELVNSLH